MKPFSCISRMPSSLVAPQTPAWVVTGRPSSRATSKAACSGNAGSPVTSKASWRPSRSPRAGPAPLEERPHRRVGRPLPRAGLDVAVGEHEPAGHRLQRVDGRLGVVDGLQAVRPVDGGGDAGLERLPGGQQVAGVDVLGPERLAVLEVVPDEVLGQRPVGAVAAHRGLPHVPVGVDHARHHDAAGRVDLPRALGHVEGRARPRRSGRPTTSTSAPRARCGWSSMVSTVPPRSTTGRPAVGAAVRRGCSSVPPGALSDECPSDGQVTMVVVTVEAPRRSTVKSLDRRSGERRH